MEELKYPSRETINKLTKALDLKGTHRFVQDWEYEVADVDQLAAYLEYYKRNKLSINEKTTLMRIILEAYNDYVTLKRGKDIYGEMIKKFLKKDFFIFEEIIKYWSCEGTELEDCFVITPFIREIGIGDNN